MLVNDVFNQSLLILLIILNHHIPLCSLKKWEVLLSTGYAKNNWSKSSAIRVVRSGVQFSSIITVLCVVKTIIWEFQY